MAFIFAIKKIDNRVTGEANKVAKITSREVGNGQAIPG
jgi:hypothetical protein